jgi:hypothetical protein
MRKLFVITMTVLGLTAFAAGASACPYMDQVADKEKQTTTVAKGKSDQSTTSETDS